MPRDLRESLGGLIDALNKARNNSEDPAEQARLQKAIRPLKALWEKELLQRLDAATPDYAAAVEAVADAEASARQGLAGAKKLEAAVAKATDAAKKIDQVLAALAPALARS